MKIFSSFHDYYDTLSFQDDQGVHYIREEINCKLYKSQNKFNVQGFNNIRLINSSFNDWINIELIAFCGKLYFQFTPNIIARYMTKISGMERYAMIWYNPELIIPDVINQINSKSIKTALINNEDKILKAFKSYMSQSSDIINEEMINTLSLKFNAPYFKIKPDYYSSTYEIYPNFESLQNVKFYKIMDINQTYQEIDMYLNSILIINKEPFQITDNKTLIEAKGFDLKTSFRHPIK